MRLSNDTQIIQDEFGFDPEQRLLFTSIRRDSSRIVKPIVAEVGSERLLLARQQETASVLFSDVPPERVRFHSPWVTFDRRLVAEYEVSPNLSTLVKELAKGEGVTLSPGISYAHRQELEGQVDVHVEAERNATAVTVYEVSEEEVRTRFARWRKAGEEFGRSFVGKFPGLSGIEKYFTEQKDTRFSFLSQVTGDLGVDGVYIEAPPNFSEVTATPGSDASGALWIPGSHKVYVITDAQEYGSVGIPVARYETRADAIRDLLPGTSLAVEEQWITASLAASFERVGLTLENATSELSTWRDLRDVEDLPFQLIAARASTFAIENALEKLQQRIASGKTSTESELHQDYLDGIHEFRIEYQVPFGIEPYFVNLHASDRTLFPTTPTDALITKDSGCVELDSGVKVTIDGVVLGTSDMGRSLPISSGAQKAYATLTRVIRESIIPSIRPGVPATEVHSQALEAITAVRGELEEAGLLEPDTDFVKWYLKRNVGHLMGKQESFSNELRPGFDHIIRVGDYGAAETPWRFGTIGISTEDMWFAGEEKTYILTLSS